MQIKRGLTAIALLSAVLTTALSSAAGASPGSPRPARIHEVKDQGPTGRAATAPTGSIAYVNPDDGNIYLTAPDGSTRRKLTTDGSTTSTYRSPSQAADGSIVAFRGFKIYRMDRTGRLLNPPFEPTIVLNLGIWSLSVSPDGQKVAYETANTCEDPDSGALRLCYQTDIVWANGSDSTAIDKHLLFFGSPRWLSNTMIVGSSFHESIYYYDLGSANPQSWISLLDDPNQTNLDEPAVSPDGTKIAYTRNSDVQGGQVGTDVWISSSNGAPPVAPTPRCATPEAKYTSLSWGPDNRSIAWVESAGIWVTTFTADIAANDCSVLRHYLVAGYDANWGPAPVIPSLNAGVSAGDVTTVEGNTGTHVVNVPLTLSAPATAPVTVTVATANGTATSGTDYVAVPNTTVTFNAGEQSKNVPITVNSDTLREGDERFSLKLLAATGAFVADNAATVTIVDDEGPLTVSVNDPAVAEGNTGATTLPFTVRLSGPPATGQSVSVKVATADGTATAAGGDYTAVPLTTLTFTAGQVAKTVAVTVNGDSVAEANETLALKLSSAVGAVVADPSGTGTILNDDGATPKPPAPYLSVGNAWTLEGNTGAHAVNVPVTLSAASATPVTVKVATVDGTATTGGGDYLALPATTLTFAPGETVKSVAVTVNGDTVKEGDETFTVALSGAIGAGLADAGGQVTIADEEGPLAVTVADASVVEGNAGPTTMVFTVKLDAAPAAGQSVSVVAATADSDATAAGGDYSPVPPTTLTFGPGQTTKSVAVTVNGDTVAEANEVLLLNLSAAKGAVLADSSAYGVIFNDDL